MIKNYIKYSLAESGKGTISSTEKCKSITLKYPCENLSTCTPYALSIKPSVYKFECWGSKGRAWTENNSGKGGYTKGTIALTKPIKLYVYIGAR